jgi:16S rRNA (cytosine967-C5)-methyltransferase
MGRGAGKRGSGARKPKWAESASRRPAREAREDRAEVRASLELLAVARRSGAPLDAACARWIRERRPEAVLRAAAPARAARIARERAALDWWLERAAPPSGLRDPDRARLLAELALVEGWGEVRIAAALGGGIRRGGLAPPERVLLRALAGQPLQHPAQPRAVRLSCPAWLEPLLAAGLGERLEPELEALRAEPSLDLRTNSLRATREEARAALRAEGIESDPTPLSPLGLRVRGRPELARTAALRGGLVEVQDEGAQLVALLVAARPAMRVADLCAGAGGKTLALAACMQNRGRLLAADVSPGRARRAAARLRRAGVHNAQWRVLADERDPWLRRRAGSFDRVLVDAPCSGTGSWRRAPDARWRLEPGDLEALRALQARLLESAARLLRPGGRLVYATCSLLPGENAEPVQAFLAAHPGLRWLEAARIWREAALPGPCPQPAGAGPGLTLTPARHGTDGFFVAVLERSGSHPRRPPRPRTARAQPASPVAGNGSSRPSRSASATMPISERLRSNSSGV